MSKELAKIRKAFLGFEDHGIFTAYLDVEYENGDCQGLGGYWIDDDYILGTLRAVGVNEWSQLVGRTIWVFREEAGDWKPLGYVGLRVDGAGASPFMFAEWGKDRAPSMEAKSPVEQMGAR